MKANMNDREYMEDVLLTSKTLTGLYHYATQESSTDGLHSQFKTNLNSALSMQRNIYSTMEQNGWYPQQQAQNEQICQVKTKFQQAQQQ